LQATSRRLNHSTPARRVSTQFSSSGRRRPTTAPAVVERLATHTRRIVFLLRRTERRTHFSSSRIQWPSFTPTSNDGSRPLHDDGYAICLLFFGFACLSLGSLVFRSRFLPRTIGALMAIAGVCYLINSFSHFLAPLFATTLFPALFVPIFIAELSLTLWLLVKGVDAAKWEEREKLMAS
jgi:Domain of unknown function (DUF4386)